MARQYDLRDSDNVLKVSFDEETAIRILSHLNFEASTVTYSSGKYTAFISKEDQKMYIRGGEITVYFWKGDKLIKGK